MPFIRHVGQAWLSGRPAPAQERSLPQHSCTAPQEAIQEGPLCHLQHLHLPSPSGFPWSTLNQTISWYDIVNHMGNACQICHRAELAVLHTRTAESSVLTESCAQGCSCSGHSTGQCHRLPLPRAAEAAAWLCLT